MGVLEEVVVGLTSRDFHVLLPFPDEMLTANVVECFGESDPAQL